MWKNNRTKIGPNQNGNDKKIPFTESSLQE